MDNYSLSDIAAVTDGGFGGNGMGGWWMIILFALIFGGNGFGFGNNRGQCATTEDLASGFNFNSLQGKTNDILAAINSEGRTTDNAICQLGYNTLSQMKDLSQQISECCCQTQQAIHAEGEATRSMMQQDKIEALQQQVNQLNLQSQLCGVVRYPMQTTYGAGYNPFFGGYAGGCGCGCTNI